MSNTVSVIGSDGTLETYQDIYKDQTPERFEEAQALQDEILQHGLRLQATYLRLARDVTTFKHNEYYLALGFPSFRDWAESPELIGIGYRSAQRYVQIVEEALPLLESHGLLEMLPPISLMSEMLPILNDDDGEKKFIEAIKAVRDLTIRDARGRIREIRGLPETTQPTVFKAVVIRGTPYHMVRIFTQGDDPYECGTLKIKPRDWSRWEERFGAFVQIKE